MKIAVIGGGINGIMTAWELCSRHHNVTLFEKRMLMSETSSASSKLLHGGLRYLENFKFGLVKEALSERQWWMKAAPNLATPIKIYIPVLKQSRRSSWRYRLGLFLYDFLTGSKKIGRCEYYSRNQMLTNCSDLKENDILNGFSYFDVKMDDKELGLWAVGQAKKYDSLKIMEKTKVERISIDGQIVFNGRAEVFDRVVNVAGPWAGKLLKDSHINSKCNLDLVRGSHIVINRKLAHGYFLEVPKEKRMFFVLPYKNQTLIGTTEVRQSLQERIKPSQQEIDYLIGAYNSYFKRGIKLCDIVQVFAGVRPLIKSSRDPNKTTREYAIEKNQRLITVFGGKWTTARQLAKKVCKAVV